MRVGMAVDGNKPSEKSKLATLLMLSAQYAGELNMWVNGVPFDQALKQVAQQLRENIAETFNVARVG
jgi:GGDEF domain-containing protein